MNKLWITIVGYFLFGSFVRAQNNNPHLDSLRKVQKDGATDSIKARAFFLYADYIYTDTINAKLELQKGRLLSKDNFFLKGLYLFYDAGLYYYIDTKRSIGLYYKALAIFERIQTSESLEFQARAWQNIGAQYHIDGEPEKFINLLTTKAIPLAEKAKNVEMIARYENNIGMLFTNQKDFETAKIYYKRSLSFYDKHPERSDIYHLELLLNIIKNLLLQGNNNDSIKFYLRKASPVAEKNKHDQLYYTFKENEANFLIQKGESKKASDLLRGLIPLAEKNHFSYEANALRFQLYRAEFDLGNYQKAKDILLNVLKRDPLKTFENRIMHYRNLSKVSVKQGNYRDAYHYLVKTLEFTDSLHQKNYRVEVNKYEKQLNLLEKENKITQLQEEKKQAVLIQTNQKLLNWILGIGATVFLLAFVLAVFFYRNRQINAAQQLKVLKQEQQLKLTQAILEAEERERQRIARDLHDGLGGALSGIKIKLSSEQQIMQIPILDQTILQLENSIGELRQIARNMMPETLIRAGLEVALRDLCVSLSCHDIQVEFQSNAIQKDITVQDQVNIYRIVQELLTNAVRHGKASTIILQCIQEGKQFLITVEDNGTGFDYDKAQQQKGIGLRNIQNRVDMMSGKVNFESGINEGTVVNIELYV